MQIHFSSEEQKWIILIKIECLLTEVKSVLSLTAQVSKPQIQVAFSITFSTMKFDRKFLQALTDNLNCSIFVSLWFISEVFS